MGAVPDASVQLVVTSPPYNVAKDYTDHDDDLSLEEYVCLLNDGVAGVLSGAGAGRPAVRQRRQHRPQAVSLARQPDRRAVAPTAARPGCIVGTSSGTKASAGLSARAWGSFGRSTNPTLRDVHEYITVWSKDQAQARQHGGETGVTGNQFVAWTRSIWRPEELVGELQRRSPQAGRRRRDKDDAWIAESIRGRLEPDRHPRPNHLGDDHRIVGGSPGAVFRRRSPTSWPTPAAARR